MIKKFYKVQFFETELQNGVRKRIDRYYAAYWKVREAYWISPEYPLPETQWTSDLEEAKAKYEEISQRSGVLHVVLWEWSGNGIPSDTDNAVYNCALGAQIKLIDGFEHHAEFKQWYSTADYIELKWSDKRYYYKKGEVHSCGGTHTGLPQWKPDPLVEGDREE